jgi:hypothetical protein
MGLLDFFSKSAGSAEPVALPNGSFTVNAAGRIVSSTLPSGFPESLLLEIGEVVNATFQEANSAQLALSEFTAVYSGFRIAARTMRGGAMVYLSTRNPNPK